MRYQNRILVSGLVVAFGLIVMVLTGCSSDDKTTTPSTNNGSLTDPVFMVVQDQVATFVDSTVSFLRQGLNTVQGISAGDTVIPVQYSVDPEGTDVFEVKYEGGWHIVNITQHEAAWATSLHDSIQYLRNSVVQQSHNGADQVHYKHHWDWDVADTTVSHQVLVGNADYSFDNVNTSAATVTGSNNLNVHSKTVSADSTVWIDLVIEATITDLTLEVGNVGWSECPTAGTVSTTVQMSYKKNSAAAVVTTWTVDMTFDEGTMDVSVTSDGVVWSYSCDVCNPPSN